MLSPALLRQIVFCIAVVWSAEASAQAYPSRQITLVVPFAAGSGVDVMARQNRGQSVAAARAADHRRQQAWRRQRDRQPSSSPRRRPTATP